MSNNISAEQALINRVMASLPEVKAKKNYTLQYGESLWGLAKKELGKKNLTDREIRDYMLLIAKLNNLDTIEKMNGLKANTQILIPESPKNQNFGQGLAAKSLNAINSNQEVNTGRIAHRTKVESSLDKLLSILINDKTIHVKKASPDFINLYHVFKEKKYASGFISNDSPVMIFKLDKQNKPERMYIEDKEDIIPLKYDYEIDAKGTVKLNNYPYKAVQQLSKSDQKAFMDEVNNLIEEYNKNPKRYY